MEIPPLTFRLEHGYEFDLRLKAPEFERDNILVGGLHGAETSSCIFLGRLAEFQYMNKNVWLDTQGAHAIDVIGKRRSGKTFTLGVIVEGLVSDAWLRKG